MSAFRTLIGSTNLRQISASSHVAKAAALSLLVALVCIGLPPHRALASSSGLDRSFGRNGVVRLLPPEYEIGGLFQGWALDHEGRFVGVGTGAVRIGPTGALDSTFGRDGYARITGPYLVETEIQPDGKILAGGSFGSGRSAASFALARLNHGGNPDRSFGNHGRAKPKFRGYRRTIRALAVTPSGRILCAGTIRRKRRRTEGIIFALRPNGRPDRRFGNHGHRIFGSGDHNFSGLTDVKVLASGKILIAGARGGRFMLARLRPNGSLDRGFGHNRGLTVKGLRGHRSAYLAKLAITRHHEIVMLTGYRYGNSYMGLARFSRRGHLDRRFSRNGFFVSRSERKTPGAPLEPTDITLRPNGRIVVSAIGFLDGENFMVRQYRPDGRADRSFFGNGVMARDFGYKSPAWSALTQPDGKVVVGGFVETGNESGPLLVRFKAGG